MKPLFLDIDTQNDFVLPAGALYAPGAERLVPLVAKLNNHAVAQGCHLISTACLHTEADPEFQEWPPHCIAGTMGQLKPAATLIGQRLFDKQHTDVFREVRWLPLLQELGATEYIVYGVVSEVCVRFAADGLLDLGKIVTVVTDAIQPLNLAAEEQFLHDFQSRGGRVVASHHLLTRN